MVKLQVSCDNGGMSSTRMSLLNVCWPGHFVATDATRDDHRPENITTRASGVRFFLSTSLGFVALL